MTQIMGLKGFGRYLATVFELDALLLNEDRHTNNLAVIRDDTAKAFRLCPIFDHGLSLLSDTGDYPLEQDAYNCIAKVRAKPFSDDFQEQVGAAAVLYGSDLHFRCTRNDIPMLLVGLEELYDERTLGKS